MFLGCEEREYFHELENVDVEVSGKDDGGFSGFPDAIGSVVVKAQIESVGIQVFPGPGFCGVANFDAGRPDGCFVRA